MMGEIVPTMNVGGNSGNGGWGDAVGAFAGALVGSWFTNGWGGGYGGGRGGYGGGPVIVNGGGHGSDCCSSAELDALSGIQSSINGLGLQLLQGQNASNLADCQGFSGVVNATNQGFSGLNNVVTTGNAAIQQSLCQGFGGLNTAILSSAKDAALQDCRSTGQIVQAISDCCCKTQNAIHAEGEATRGLIQQNYINSLQEKLCDCKSENSALKSQNFIAASQAAQTAQIQAQLDRQAVQYGALIASYRAGRIDERDSTATTPAA